VYHTNQYEIGEVIIMKKNLFRSGVRFIVRHLGLMIFCALFIVIMFRGFSLIDGNTAMLLVGLACVPVLFLHVYVMYTDNPNALAKRLAQRDVLIALGLVVLYIGMTSGLLLSDYQ
jgi:amino acid permease